MKKLNEFGFTDLTKLYFVFSLFIGVIIPLNIEIHFPMSGVFLNIFCDILPGIKNISQYSGKPNYIKLYYAIQWIMFPVFYLLFYFSIRKTKKTTDLKSDISFSYIFYLVFLVFLSLLMIYMMGFHYKEYVDRFSGGRVGALLTALSTEYVVGLASPIIFLAIFIISAAPALMIEELFIRLKNRRKK